MSSDNDKPARPLLPVWLFGAWALCTAALLPLFLAAQWAGSEVAKYQRTTFESATRQALAARDYGAAIKYCDGAIKAAHKRSDHWGRVYTLRSVAYLGKGDTERAALEVERAGDFFTRYYYYAEPQDRTEVPQVAMAVARRLLSDGKPAEALDVISAGAMASGRPVDALHGYLREFDAPARQQLWGNGEPFIRVTALLGDKDSGLRAVVNEQGRKVSDALMAAEEGPDGAPAARATLSESQADGVCWLAIPTYVPLSNRPFAVRVRAKLEKPADLPLQLGYWFESPQKSATTQDKATATDAAGWMTYDVRRAFFAERRAEALQEGYASDGGVINQIALLVPPGEANTLWLARAEIYLPKG